MIIFIIISIIWILVTGLILFAYFIYGTPDKFGLLGYSVAFFWPIWTVIITFWVLLSKTKRSKLFEGIKKLKW